MKRDGLCVWAFTAALLLSGLIFVPTISEAQSTAPAPAPAPPPAVTPPDFPQYIVTPSEDLDPYDLSTMEKSTETNYRSGTGTLGTTPERTSNVQVNEALQKSRQEKLKAAEQKAAAEAEAPDEAAIPEDLSAAPEPDLPSPDDDLSSPGMRGGLFTWVDQNGVLHATNDIGQVPIEYQIQAIEDSKDINLNKGAD